MAAAATETIVEAIGVPAGSGRGEKRCGVCRRSYDPAAWDGLAIVKTLPSSSIQPHLSVPAGWSIELRRCTCGATLARRA